MKNVKKENGDKKLNEWKGNGFKTCPGCPTPARCTATGQCLYPAGRANK
jgi:hypothetical protein